AGAGGGRDERSGGQGTRRAQGRAGHGRSAAADHLGLMPQRRPVGARRRRAVIRQVRGWSEEQWAAATGALRARGLLTTDADGATGPAPGAEPATAAADGVLGLTPAGRAVLDTIEAHTDERAWTGGLAALGVRGVEEVLALLRPSVRAVVASGM